MVTEKEPSGCLDLIALMLVILLIMAFVLTSYFNSMATCEMVSDVYELKTRFRWYNVCQVYDGNNWVDFWDWLELVD